MQNCVFNGQVGAGDAYGIHVCYQMLMTSFSCGGEIFTAELTHMGFVK